MIIYLSCRKIVGRCCGKRQIDNCIEKKEYVRQRERKERRRKVNTKKEYIAIESREEEFSEVLEKNSTEPRSGSEAEPKKD